MLLIGLETFLSGMETPVGTNCPRVPFPPLKPSLVEWKPRLGADTAPIQSPLETFLSGMETRKAFF